KAEARRYVAAQKANLASVTNEKARTEAGSTESLPKCATEGCFPKADFSGDIEPVRVEPAQEQPLRVTNCGSGSRTGRRAAGDAYIEKEFERTGQRLTQKDIWRHARYKTRTEFERWQWCDPRTTKAAAERFSRIL